MYYIGLDVHKKTISYCVKDAAGQVHREGKIGSTRRELDAWITTLPALGRRSISAFPGAIELLHLQLNELPSTLPHQTKLPETALADCCGICSSTRCALSCSSAAAGLRGPEEST
jgi:hypothetical protein